jgi:hypothetical protein
MTTDTAARTRMGLASDTPGGMWFDTNFVPRYHDFHIAFLEWLNPAERTQLKITVLDETETEFKPTYRQFYTGFLKSSPLVTDDDFHKKDFSSNHRHVLAFPREQFGRQAYIYARYSNAHGKECPEGPTETVVIN